MDTLWKDCRFAVRPLAKSPGFIRVALLALVLGIGANTAISSIVSASLMRPLPYREPDKLMMVWEHSPHTGKNNVVNPQNFLDWQARNHSFDEMAAFIETKMNLMGNGEPEQVRAAFMVVRQALVLALIGDGAGLAGALVLTRFLKTLLFDVTTTDFGTFAAVPVVLCIVAMAASWIPALRATRVDPMVALRSE
jgi:ABC-type antimicrobial peptide transport system permease subunit